jgi:hypothetical protein
MFNLSGDLPLDEHLRFAEFLIDRALSSGELDADDATRALAAARALAANLPPGEQALAEFMRSDVFEWEFDGGTLTPKP